jgi:hypothetical protein
MPKPSRKLNLLFWTILIHQSKINNSHIYWYGKKNCNFRKWENKNP